MPTSIHANDRILLRDRPWRVSRVAPIAEGCHLLTIKALDGDEPRMLDVAVPPEEPTPLGGEELVFDRTRLESSAAWSCAHRIIAATLVCETGVTAVRFGRVELESYQLAPVLRVISKPRASLLIADDVGLGKTIEAGFVMLELTARRRASRVLVVTPAGLVDQWYDELLDKFGLEFKVIANATGLADAQSELPAGVSPWDALPRVITSMDFIKKETVGSRAGSSVGGRHHPHSCGGFCTWPLFWMPGVGRLSVGRWPTTRRPGSYWTLWTWRWGSGGPRT